MSDRMRDVLRLLLEMSGDEIADVYVYLRSRLLPEDGNDEVFVCEMNSVVGEDINARTRRHNVVWGRYIVLSELLDCGWSTTRAGAVFGLDHATVTYAKHRVEDMLQYPKQYSAEMELYREFKKRIYR